MGYCKQLERKFNTAGWVVAGGCGKEGVKRERKLEIGRDKKRESRRPGRDEEEEKLEARKWRHRVAGGSGL